jgi:hypothetical protein
MGNVSSMEREERIRAVKDAIEAQGWSSSLEAALAVQIGTSTRTIRTYKLEVAKRIASRAAAFDDLDPREARAEFLDRLRSHQRRAAADKVKVEIGRSPPIIHLGLPSFDEIEKTPNDDPPAE